MVGDDVAPATSAGDVLGLDLPHDVREFYRLLEAMHPSDRESFCRTTIDTGLEHIGRAVDVARWRDRDGPAEPLADLVSLADRISTLRAQWAELQRVAGAGVGNGRGQAGHAQELREGFELGLGQLLHGFEIARWRDQDNAGGPSTAVWGVIARIAIAWGWERQRR